MKNRFLFLFLFSLLVQNVFAQPPDSLKNTLSLGQNYTHFDKQFSDDWHMTSLEYKTQTGKGAIIGRIDHASRFGRQGWQWEGEAYPRFSKKIYGYAAVAYSAAMPVFSKFRSGASVYVNLPKAWEAEGGLRQLYFTKTIWIAVGGLSKYAGNWLFNLRSFLSKSTGGMNQSYFVSARRYFGERNSYVWMQAGSGISPDENRSVQFQSGGQLSSKQLTAGCHYFTGKRLIVLLGAGYSTDEYETDVFGNRFFGSVGLGFRF